MIIIVEGISRVGKTTLCNKLKTKFNIPIYKHNTKLIDYNKMSDNIEVEKMLCMLDMYKTIPSNIIFDRFHFSNTVYGILLRNYDKQSAFQNVNKIESYIKQLGIKNLLLKVSPNNIEESSRQYGRDLKPFENLITELYNNSILDKYNCDYNTEDELIKKLEKIINTKE